MWTNGIESPITAMGSDANEISTHLNGAVKTHVQYAITYDTKDVIETEFWNKQKEYPLLLISLLHIKHDDQSKDALDTLNRLNKEHLSDRKGNFRCLPYISLNCSDIVLFSLANSYSDVMYTLYNICSDDIYRIQDSFTIYAYQRKMNACLSPSDDSSLLERWVKAEPTLKNIQIYLRSHNIKSIGKLSDKVCRTLGTQKCQVYVLPGQEDILIVVDELPVGTLIALYGDAGDLSFSRMVEKGIISRTLIGFSSKDFHTRKTNHDRANILNSSVDASSVKVSDTTSLNTAE
jgi:hypothetical protein